MQWLGAVWQRAITCPNFDPLLLHHVRARGNQWVKLTQLFDRTNMPCRSCHVYSALSENKNNISQSVGESPHAHIMTSSNGNVFRVAGPLCGESTGHRWIPPNKGQWRGTVDLRLNKLLSNRNAANLRRHRAHYDVTVMQVITHSYSSQVMSYFLHAHTISKSQRIWWKLPSILW